jgi:hypothetical protein
MIIKVEIRNAQGSLLVLPLTDVSNGYVVTGIEGLDPVKATLVSSSFAQLDGSQYHSSRRESRNIKLNIGLRPTGLSGSVQTLRMRLYDYFMTKAAVSLRFYMSGGLTVDIQGRVETCANAIFSKEPQVDVSIMCFDPDLVDLTPVVLAGVTTASSAEGSLTYNGSVETGIVFALNVDRSVSEFTFYHRPASDTLRSLTFAGALVAGDILTISTVPGDKGAILTRGGSNTSVLYGVSPQSNWIELLRGINYIRVYTEGVGIPYTISYTTKYGGL